MLKISLDVLCIHITSVNVGKLFHTWDASQILNLKNLKGIEKCNDFYYSIIL